MAYRWHKTFLLVHVGRCKT